MGSTGSKPNQLNLHLARLFPDEAERHQITRCLRFLTEGNDVIAIERFRGWVYVFAGNLPDALIEFVKTRPVDIGDDEPPYGFLAPLKAIYAIRELLDFPGDESGTTTLQGSSIYANSASPSRPWEFLVKQYRAQGKTVWALVSDLARTALSIFFGAAGLKRDDEFMVRRRAIIRVCYPKSVDDQFVRFLLGYPEMTRNKGLSEIIKTIHTDSTEVGAVGAVISSPSESNDMDPLFDMVLADNWIQHATYFRDLVHALFLNTFMRTTQASVVACGFQGLDPHLEQDRIAGTSSPSIYNMPKPNQRLIRMHEIHFIISALQPKFRTKWTCIYNSLRDGNSWTVFNSSILHQGSTVVLIKDRDGYVFGGFCSRSWTYRPDFYGDGESFVFELRPKLRVHRATGINCHYQYLNHGKKQLPNGMGMGGQLDYFGLWLSADFTNGHSKAEPLSTTFSSPQLSGREEYELEQLEVWQVKEPDETNDDLCARGLTIEAARQSVLDKHPELVEFLDMAGHEMLSKQVREPELMWDDGYDAKFRSWDSAEEWQEDLQGDVEEELSSS